MNENLNTEVFTRPIGGDVINLLQAARREEMLREPQIKGSSYDLRAPEGMEARFIQDPDRDPYVTEKDDLEINILGKSADRTITANVEVDPREGMEIAVISRVHERRRVNLPGDIQVAKSITYGHAHVKRELGDHLNVEETTTILTPLESPLLEDGKPVSFEYAFDNDITESAEPNATLYERKGKDASWTKTYVYKSQDGKINMPEYEGSTTESSDIVVKNIPITTSSEQEKLGAIMMQVNLGDADQSLSELVSKKVIRKSI